jgi:hypothetical protein
MNINWRALWLRWGVAVGLAVFALLVIWVGGAVLGQP